MANYPTVLNQQWLNNRAQPKEQRVVRVEIRGVHNLRPLTISGKGSTRYLLHYDNKTAAHVLDIPESIWMEQNGKLARDLMSPRPNPPAMVVLVLPYKANKDAGKKAKPLPKAESTPTQTPEELAHAALGT